MCGKNALPVGYRFHPTDEELVSRYLLPKVRQTQDEPVVIKDIDLYKFEPEDLHNMCMIGDDAPHTQTDLYFFSHKDKKYPTGNRANRATAAGFWKATGRDTLIHEGRQLIGMRKTLVFYRGRASNRQKTDWIMYESRLDEGPGVVPNYEANGWVVCRVFRKTKKFKSGERASRSFDEEKVEPELSSPEKFSSDCGDRGDSFNNNDYFTGKQDLSVDDYNTPTDAFEVHRFEGDASLAPSSSCTFRGDESSVPFLWPTTVNEFDYPLFHKDD